MSEKYKIGDVILLPPYISESIITQDTKLGTHESTNAYDDLVLYVYSSESLTPVWRLAKNCINLTR